MDIIYMYSHSYKRVLVATLPIVLPSLMLKPANVILVHLWIEEDLIYTSVCQAFGFDQS